MAWPSRMESAIRKTTAQRHPIAAARVAEITGDLKREDVAIAIIGLSATGTFRAHPNIVLAPLLRQGTLLRQQRFPPWATAGGGNAG